MHLNNKISHPIIILFYIIIILILYMYFILSFFRQYENKINLFQHKFFLYHISFQERLKVLLLKNYNFILKRYLGHSL